MGRRPAGCSRADPSPRPSPPPWAHPPARTGTHGAARTATAPPPSARPRTRTDFPMLTVTLCVTWSHNPAHSPFSGLKKLKKESLGTCLVIVLTVPRPLCFCFFLMVLTVTFFPFFQSMVHLQGQDRDHGYTLHEKNWSHVCPASKSQLCA